MIADGFVAERGSHGEFYSANGGDIADFVYVENLEEFSRILHWARNDIDVPAEVVVMLC